MQLFGACGFQASSDETNVWLRAEFNFFEWHDLSQTWRAYSAAEKHNAKAVILSVCGFVPHLELVYFFRMLFLVLICALVRHSKAGWVETMFQLCTWPGNAQRPGFFTVSKMKRAHLRLGCISFHVVVCVVKSQLIKWLFEIFFNRIKGLFLSCYTKVISINYINRLVKWVCWLVVNIIDIIKQGSKNTALGKAVALVISSTWFWIQNNLKTTIQKQCCYQFG